MSKPEGTPEVDKKKEEVQEAKKEGKKVGEQHEKKVEEKKDELKKEEEKKEELKKEEEKKEGEKKDEEKKEGEKKEKEQEKKVEEKKEELKKEEEKKAELKKEQEKKEEQKEGDKKGEPGDIETLFHMYSKFGDKHGHKGMTLKNKLKWFNQADIIGDKAENITKEDVTKAYNSIAKEKDRVKFPEFRKMIRSLAIDKKTIDEEILNKLIAAGTPKISGVTDLFSTMCKSCKG